MAGATGLEPATSGVTGRRSNQLSYAPATRSRRHLLARRSGGVKQLPSRMPEISNALSQRDDQRVSNAWRQPTATMLGDQAIMYRFCCAAVGLYRDDRREGLVGDEGFEPPTPSV